MENTYTIQRIPRYSNISMCLYFSLFLLYLITSTCVLTLSIKTYELFLVFCIFQTIFNLIIGIGLPLSSIYKNIKLFTKYSQYLLHLVQFIVLCILPSNTKYLSKYYHTPIFTLFICNIIINTFFGLYYYIYLSIPKIRYLAVPNV